MGNQRGDQAKNVESGLLTFTLAPLEYCSADCCGCESAKELIRSPHISDVGLAECSESSLGGGALCEVGTAPIELRMVEHCSGPG